MSKESKNKHSVHFTSKSQTWNTPKDFFNGLNEHWKFTVDVACLSTSALVQEKYFTPETDGLTQSWAGERFWCNPPYDNLKTWIEKCFHEYENNDATGMILIPSRTDTQAFQNYIFPRSTAVCFIKRRLKFDNPSLPSWSEDGSHKVSSAPFPSCIVVLGEMTEEQLSYLKTVGSVMRFYED